MRISDNLPFLNAIQATFMSHQLDELGRASGSTVNVVDGLFAIARAIERLANAIEDVPEDED